MRCKEKTMHELIIEEIKRNPILTEEDLAEMLKPESEEDVRKEEELNEAIFERVCMLEDKRGHILSDTEFKKVVYEEKIRRKIL